MVPAGVARHLDFRDDGHEPFLRVGDDVADLVLGVKAAVAPSVAVELLAPVTDVRLVPVCRDLGKARVRIDLDPPALVLRQVPVKAVDLVSGEHVDVVLHEVRPKEVTGNIQVHATVGETWRVFDPHSGDLDSGAAIGTPGPGRH